MSFSSQVASHCLVLCCAQGAAENAEILTTLGGRHEGATEFFVYLTTLGIQVKQCLVCAAGCLGRYKGCSTFKAMYSYLHSQRPHSWCLHEQVFV